MTSSSSLSDSSNAQKPLSAISATSLVVGNMIGVGLFTTTGFLAGELGDPLIILGVWVVGGLLALCGAAVYGELGAMMPRAGGEYIYLSEVFHPAVGFLSGWVSLLVGFSAPIALTAHAFGIYLHAALPYVPAKPAAVVLIIVLAVLHTSKVVWSGRMHVLFTAYKVVLIIVFLAAAFTMGDGNWQHFIVESNGQTPAMSQLAVALVLVSFAYSGWNVAAYVASEIRDAPRALPRALLWGTGLVLALFLLLNISFFYAAPPSVLAASPEEVGYVAAQALFGDVGAVLTSLLIGFSLISSVSAMLIAGPRVYAAMAEDGLFLSVFARRGRGGAPWASILLQAGVALTMLYTSTFIGLLTYIGVMLSVSAGITVSAAFVLRRRAPEAERPYRALGWPVSGLLYLALVGGMAVLTLIERPIVLLAAAATVGIGMILYWITVMRG